MYDAAKLFRSVFVCIFLGLFLADFSLAASGFIAGLPVWRTSDTCHPSFNRVCDDMESILSGFGGPSNWTDIKLVRKSCTPSEYEAYFTGKLEEGELLQSNVYGLSIVRCEYDSGGLSPPATNEQCESKKGQKFREGKFSYEITGKGKGAQLAITAGFGGSPVGTCDGGCTVSGQLEYISYKNYGKDNELAIVSVSGGTYTGQSCETSDDSLGLPDPPKPPDTYIPDPKDGIAPGWSSAPKPNDTGVPVCPKGRCPGQVNGMDICVICDATTSVSGSSTSTTKQDGSGGNGKDDSKSKSTTTCANGKCETTTTTTTSSSTSESKTETTTTTQTQIDYCAKNPQDKVNCTKDKDPGDDDCKSSPLRLACLSLGTPDSVSDSPGKHTADVRYQPGEFVTGAGCPTPKTFTIWGSSYTLSFEQFCDLAKYIKPLVLLMASITTMFIVIYGLKR